MNDLKGICVALHTPFTEAGNSVDEDSLGSMADLIRIQELLTVCGERVRVFNGGDPIAFYSMVAGCPGCVWGAANAMPELAVKLYDLVSAGKISEAQSIWEKMFPSQLFFWTHDYNPAVKAATNLSGRNVGLCRKPQMPLPEKEIADLKEAMKPMTD